MKNMVWEIEDKGVNTCEDKRGKYTCAGILPLL